MTSRFPAFAERISGLVLWLVLGVLTGRAPESRAATAQPQPPAAPASGQTEQPPAPPSSAAELAEPPSASAEPPADLADPTTGPPSDPPTPIITGPPEPARDPPPKPVANPPKTTPPEEPSDGSARPQPSTGPPVRPGSNFIPGVVSEVDLTDPLGPIETALDELQTKGFRVRNRRRTVNALQGEMLTAELTGTQTRLLRYVLEAVAIDGFQILIEPTGRDAFALQAIRTRSTQGRGVTLVSIDEIQIDGRFRKGENATTIRKVASLPTGGIGLGMVTDQIERLGYRVQLWATGPGQLLLSVEPGRSIRRVRVRGYIPISERDIRRVLSPRARPGAIAPGQCLAARTLRKERPTSSCSPGDLGCQRWEQDEIDRIETYLFDNGYLRGRAQIGLRCGKPGQADLFIYLNKGKPYRARKATVTGNISSYDQRWISRAFRPVRIVARRITRKEIDRAKDRVAREYAQPRGGPGSRTRRQLELPYPAVRVETNFDRLQPGDPVVDRKKFKLEVNVQLSDGVRTDFLNNDRVTETRLRNQISLFSRREPATATSAVREASNLRNYYQTRGFMLAEVEGRYQDFGQLKQLTFVIDEGPRVRIREIEVARPPGIPKKVLREIESEFRTKRSIKSRGRFTDANARSDLGALLTAYADRGYLCARAVVRVAWWKGGLDQKGANAVLDPLSQLKTPGQPGWLQQQLDKAGLAALRDRDQTGLFVRIEVDPGPRVLSSGREVVRHLEIKIPPSREVGNLPTTEEGRWGAPRILRDGPLRRKGDERPGGIPINLNLARKTERAIRSQYRRSGFPLADAELRWVYTDARGTVHRVAQAERLASNEIGMCRDKANADNAMVDTELSVYEGRSGVFGTALVRGNFKTLPYVLRNEIAWSEGERYDEGRSDQTKRDIERTGVVESVQISKQARNCEFTDAEGNPCVVHHVITITESKDRGMDLAFGIGGATLDPLYVFARPSFPNFLGTGWDLQLDGHLGTNLAAFQTTFCTGEDCYERSARLVLTRQRIFASPLTFEISGQIQRRVTPARGQIDSASGSVRLTWPVDKHWRVYFGYLFQAANISKGVVKPTRGVDVGCGSAGTGVCRTPNRGESIVTDNTGAIQSGVSWQKVDNAFNPQKGMLAAVDLMFASPYFGGRDWWFRHEYSWQHFIPLPGADRRFNFRYSLTYGHAVPLRRLPGANTTSIPEIWRYFAGGTADLGVRGLEPQTLLVDIEEVQGPYGTVRLRPSAQGGHIRALATFALQAVSVRDFLGGQLAHSVFVDLGVLTQRWRHVQPLRDIRRSVGLNFIKWDIRIVTVALGYAWLVPNRVLPQNVRPTDDANGRFIFDVGATF